MEKILLIMGMLMIVTSKICAVLKQRIIGKEKFDEKDVRNQTIFNITIGVVALVIGLWKLLAK